MAQFELMQRQYSCVRVDVGWHGRNTRSWLFFRSIMLQEKRLDPQLVSWHDFSSCSRNTRRNWCHGCGRCHVRELQIGSSACTTAMATGGKRIRRTGRRGRMESGSSETCWFTRRMQVAATTRNDSRGDCAFAVRPSGSVKARTGPTFSRAQYCSPDRPILLPVLDRTVRS